ncbi:MAG TPA: FAD-dependent oxidoreductase [Polyangia bacterium]|jgi:protoporphyrinogen oxidase|nr:FAD-dependent oxidoreductase [Polyangia bacterium]
MTSTAPSVHTVIVGAGISGLATAAALSASGDDNYLVLEADAAIGGYCKTIRRDGFVWDYSGHFFHFKHPEIESWLRERMAGQKIRVVDKKSFIAYGGRQIDFPFQKNIHQLPQAEFIDCLYDLYFARAPLHPGGDAAPPAEANFKEMLYARFGRAIAERFLIPYNEKLYACDLSTLDRDAMGRFFPHADLTDVIRNMKVADNRSYNSTFTYPEGGAFEYVRALASAVRPDAIALEEPLVGIDLERKIARTPRREIRFDRLVSSAPFFRLAQMSALAHDPSVFSWNKVLVFNLGFDRKGPRDVHWIYYPDRSLIFYRVGFYDNIFGVDPMSLYVEIGFPRAAEVDVEALRLRVLADLERAGVTQGHRLVAHHSVVMDPAYVHITRQSIAEHGALIRALRAHDVYSIGRYGGWTYCSIEDNIVEARALVARLARGGTSGPIPVK